MRNTRQAPLDGLRYFPIYLESLRVNAMLDFDLYLERGREFVLFRAASLPFTDKTRQNLLDNNITHLYVAASDSRCYYRYLETCLPELVRDASIRETRRANLVYETALFLIKDLFAKPTFGQNIRRSQDLVQSTVSFILASRSAFAALLDILAFDYTTYTHSVNVCALALALAQQSGITDPHELHTLGTGALLHDIAKTPCLGTKKLHAQEGERILLAKGYPELAYLVRQHVYLHPEHPLDETMLVNYADKRVNHDQVVDLAARFDYIEDRYGENDPERLARIARGRRWSQAVERMIFGQINHGKTPDMLI